jgi:hypothetical protein
VIRRRLSGHTPRESLGHIRPGARRLIAERYARGETMAALASEFSVGEATVWRALRSEANQRLEQPSIPG